MNGCSGLKLSASQRLVFSRCRTLPEAYKYCRFQSTFKVKATALQSHDHDHVQGLLLHRADVQSGQVHKHFYPSVWLRDHCRCPACFYPQTQQRQADTLKACEHARIVDVQVVGASVPFPVPSSQGSGGGAGEREAVKITWEGGHESCFEPSWLHRYSVHIDSTPSAPRPRLPQLRQATSGRDLTATWTPTVPNGAAKNEFQAPPYADESEDPANDSRSAQLWSAVESFGQTSPTATPSGGPQTLPRVAAQAYMQTAQGLFNALELLRSYGFVLIEGLEATMEATEAAARRIAPPMRTLYSETGMWRTEIRPDPTAVNDTAFTTLPLAAHTDGNYCLETPGLQCFHALQADRTGGGRTQLIDAVAVAHSLAATQPHMADRLTRLKIPYHHTDPQSMVWAYKPILKLCDAGTSLAAVHWNADDRAPYTGSPGASKEAVGEEGQYLSPAAQQVVDFYGAVQAWRSALSEAKWSLWLDLKPGTLLIFDNHRVLHGRSAVHPASGRVLAGCYHSTEDWKSKLRVLRSQGFNQL